MGSRRWLLFVSGILLQLFVLTIAQENIIEKYCGNTGTYTSNSAFRGNLDTVPSSFTSDATFYNFSIGHNPGKVNVIALCRGDISPDLCRSCLNETNSILRENCTNEKESIIWSDNCMFRYSDRAIFNTIQIVPNAHAYNEKQPPDAKQFNKAMRYLLKILLRAAANGSSDMKFATGNMSVAENLKIYGLVQCTPDLTGQQCSDCLTDATADLSKCCEGKRGGRRVLPSCNFRYETEPFYSGTTIEVPPIPGNDDSKTWIIIISTVVPTIIFAVLFGIFMFRRNRKPRVQKDTYDVLNKMSSEESLKYDFDTIEVATQNFSDSNKLGQGGFGAVYKGRLLDGREIAVKRLSRDSRQGELEFENEVRLLAQLQHRSLVRLLGYSLQGTERLLIYEFVPNGSLDNFIFGPKRRANLDVDTHYNIITGVARGLLYLHEDSRLKIIHRDLKASNILLDAKMYPKIADFGTARLFAPEETRADTSRIVGTYGYMAPEYVGFGQFSVKLDVFSFGVLVLEIISGQRNKFQNGENTQYFLSDAWKNWRHGRASNVIDPILRHDEGSTHNIKRCIHIALLCVQENEADRPTMASVVLMLSSPSQTLPAPSKPAFFNNDSSVSVHQEDTPNINEDTPEINEPAQMSINEVSITDLSAK